jgi:hypothetical protein
MQTELLLMHPVQPFALTTHGGNIRPPMHTTETLEAKRKKLDIETLCGVCRMCELLTKTI